MRKNAFNFASFIFTAHQRRKVMFSHASVSHSVQEGWVYLVPCPFGRGEYLWSEVPWGVCMGVGGLSRGWVSPPPTPHPQSPLTPSGDHHTWSASGQYTSFRNAFLLPPANEVWGKVMLLHLCVILFTGGGGLPPWESASRGLVGQNPPPPIGYYGIRSTSGRYASYWNAFLLE